MKTHHCTQCQSVLLKGDWVAAAAIVVMLLGCGAYQMIPGVAGTYHDDAIYVATAKALAQGQGYRLINLPGAPLQTKYPFLYPLILAAVWKLWPEFPQNLVIMQYLTLLIASIALGLAYLYLVRFKYCSRQVAFGIGVLCATSPDIIFFSTMTMSEMLFTLLTVMALWRVELATIKPQTMPRALLNGAILGAPFLCRDVGAAIIVSAIAVLVLRRQPFLWITVGAGFITAPWVLWSVRAWGGFDSNVASGYYTDYFGAWTTLISAIGPLHLFTTNWRLLFADSSSKTFPGLFALLAGEGIPTNPLVFGLGILAWGAIVLDTGRLRVLSWSLLLYALLITIWPWPPSRFLVPLLPFIAAYFITGLYGAIRRLIPQRAIVCLGAIVCAVTVGGNLALGVRLHATSPRHEYASSWISFQDLFRWINMHADQTDIVASGLDTMISLYTDREAIRPFAHRPDILFYGVPAPATGTPAELVEFLHNQQVKYLIETPMAIAEEPSFKLLLQELKSRYPGFLAEVYRGADPRFVVYRVHPQPG